MSETVEALRERGCTPVACGGPVDKSGIDEIADVPVQSPIRVIRVAEEASADTGWRARVRDFLGRSAVRLVGARGLDIGRSLGAELRIDRPRTDSRLTR